jgi:hypothetical protein
VETEHFGSDLVVDLLVVVDLLSGFIRIGAINRVQAHQRGILLAYPRFRTDVLLSLVVEGVLETSGIVFIHISEPLILFIYWLQEVEKLI